MAYLQKQFEKFHETIRTDYETNSELREKRDIILGKIEKSLKDKDRPAFRRLMQGSLIMGTATFPLGEKEYDIDVGLHFEFSETAHTAAEVRGWVIEAIENHTRDVSSKGPCIRVRYAKGFHVDLVTYASWKVDLGIDQCRLAHKTRGWLNTDPRGLLEHVRDKQKPYENTNGGTQTNQLRRIIRYLKRWDDVWQPDESDAKPPGLAFTLLAIQHGAPTFDLEQRLDDMAFLTKLANWASYQTRISARKPTPEYEDVFGKVPDDAMKELVDRFGKMHTALQAAKSEVDPCKAASILVPIFGDDFPVPEPKETAKRTHTPAIVSSSSSG